MKIGEVIAEVKKLYPNNVENTTMIRWLCELDRQIVDEIINIHEKPAGYKTPDFDSYDMDTELVVDAIYSELYMHFLKMKISLEYVEAERYEMAKTNYNDTYITYRNYYNRNHMPITKKVPRYR